MRSVLDPRVSEAFDEKVPKGVVVSVQPTPGTEVRRGTDVALVVSKGPERYAVPPVVGMTVAEASARIEAVNLKVGKVTEAFSEKVPRGRSCPPSPARAPRRRAPPSR